MSLKDLAREACYRLLYAWTGQGQGIRVILLYHSVGGEPPFSIPLNAFEQQMELLAERFRIVRLCDLPEALANEPLETNIACVTFDDGYRDNYEVALPILDRFGIKATFFITAGFIGKSLRNSFGEHAMMDARQVEELAREGHEIGAHTINHPKLTQVPLERAWQEIDTSKQFLENLLQRPIHSFAFPKGDYNQAIKSLVQKAGFQLAVTIHEAFLETYPDWLALPRVWVNGSISLKGFEARLSPALMLYRKWRKQGLGEA